MFVRILFLIAFLQFLPDTVSPIWASGSDALESGRKTSQSLISQGKNLFVQYCAHCHGTSGDGDGFNAEYLEKEPAELSHKKFQAKKTNHQIFRAIQKGGEGVRKSTLMPVFGNTLSEAEIWALVAYVRYLGKDDAHPVFLPTGASTERPAGMRLSRKDIQAFAHWLEEEGKKDALAAEGEKLFKKKKSCFACHQLDDEGGRVGPELSRSGRLYRPEWIYAWVMNPQAYQPESKMPNMGMLPEEARSITAFLNSRVPEDRKFSDDLTPYLQATGDPEKGKALFYDPEGQVYCSKCHRVHGKGGEVGPDLSHAGTSRTAEFLLESILDPKAVITSGYATVLILTREGKFITGIKEVEDDSGMEIVDKEGREIYIRKEEIKKYKTQKISMMPGNFKDLLEVQEVADILAYLKTLTLPEFSKEPKPAQ